MQEKEVLGSRRLSPFQGPTPFTERDKEWFFGRDRETDQVLSLILGHKVVLIYAQSGAGKTSLINSKIIPELEENGLFVFPVARVRIQETRGMLTELSEKPAKTVERVHLQSNYLTTTNESSYNPFMSSVLQYLMTESGSQKEINHSSSPKISTLSDFLEEKLVSKADKTGIVDKKGVAIIFDQLEELFRSSRDRSRETQMDFFNQIAKALEKEDLSLRVILVIREDYLAQLDPFAFILPEKLRTRFRLDRLSKDEAREALEQPLIKAKEFFNEPGINERIDELFRKPRENTDSESATGMMLVQSQSLRLTERIVNNLCTMQVELPDGSTKEVFGEYVEPIYLQIVGQRLWAKLKSAPTNQMTSEHLGEVGDVNIALKDFYEDAILETSLNSKISESDIRVWFEKNLITSSGTRGSVHRGLEFTMGMPNKILDLLENKHVIRAETRTGGKWYELTHDRLLKPLIDSNRVWKDILQAKIKREYKVSKLKYILMIGIPVIFFILLGSVYLGKVTLSPDLSISSLAYNANTNTIYAGDRNGSIFVINGTTLDTIEKISLGPSAISALGFNYKNNLIYAGDRNGTIFLIDGSTNLILNHISLGPSAISALAFNNKNNMFYAGFNESIYVINLSLNRTLSPIPIYSEVSALAVNPITGTIYAGGPSTNKSIYAIDWETNDIEERIPSDENATALAVNPKTEMIYFGGSGSSCLNDNHIGLIHGATNDIVGYMISNYTNFQLLDVCRLSALAVNPITDMIYYISRDYDLGQTVGVIDGRTREEVGTIPISKSTALTIDPINNYIYVAVESNYSQPTLLKLDGNSNTMKDKGDIYYYERQ